MSATPHDRLETTYLTLVCGAVDDSLLQAALKGGVDAVQLQLAPDVPDSEVVDSVARVRRLCDEYGALLVLQDRVALVPQTSADGVYLSDGDRAAIETARALLGPDRLLGIACHTPQEVNEVGDLPVDYFHLGPIHETPADVKYAPSGPASVTFASRNTTVPFFATGGIEPHNTGELAAAGAQRIAVTRALTESSDPERSAMVMRSEIQAPIDFLQRYRARTEASNAAARAKLDPLEPGERPLPLQLAVAIAALAGIVNLIAFAAGAKVNGSHLSAGEVGSFTVIAFILAAGMWQRNWLALLAFMAVLAIVVVLFSLFLIEASNVLGVLVALVFIGVAGYLFWKLIRVLGRIQAPQT